MLFKEWVEGVGGARAAGRLLGTSGARVSYWLQRGHYPRMDLLARIFITSNHQVDFWEMLTEFQARQRVWLRAQRKAAAKGRV